MVIRPSLHPRTCMSTCLVGESIVIKINSFGIYETTMVSMATYHAIQKNGGVWEF